MARSREEREKELEEEKSEEELEKEAEEEALLEAEKKKEEEERGSAPMRSARVPEEVEKSLMTAPTNPNDGVILLDMDEFINVTLPGIITKAVEPLQREIASLRTSNGELTKAFNANAKLLDENVERQLLIQKALKPLEVISKSLTDGAAAADIIAKASTAKQDAAVNTSSSASAEVADKSGATGAALTAPELREAHTLLNKAMDWSQENDNREVPGLVANMAYAVNSGTIRREQIETLRKGLQQVGAPL